MTDDREISRIELMKLMADEAETNVDDPAFDTCQSHISEFACAEDKRQLVDAVKKARAQRDEAVALLRRWCRATAPQTSLAEERALVYAIRGEGDAFLARLDAAKPKPEDSPNSRKLAPPEEVP